MDCMTQLNGPEITSSRKLANTIAKRLQHGNILQDKVNHHLKSSSSKNELEVTLLLPLFKLSLIWDTTWYNQHQNKNQKGRENFYD